MTTVTRASHHPARWHLAPTVTGVMLLAGAVLGVVAWSRQLAGGLAETGLDSVVPWGLYTVLFTGFAATSAGALGLGCTSVLLRGPELTALLRPALGVAVAGAAAAVLTAVVNLAHPDRAAQLLLHPNWGAPYVWNLYGLLATLVLAIALVVVSARSTARSAGLRALALVGLVAALALPTLAAWVFTLPLGQATWNDPLLTPTLLASSATAGVALVSLTTLAFAVRSHQEVGRPLRDRLAVLLLTALGATFLLTVFGYVTALNSGPKERAVVQLVLPGGAWGWLFWTQWLAGLLAVALLAVPALRRGRAGLGVATAGATVAVLALYAALLPAGETRPPVSLPPGSATGRWGADTSSFVQVGSYLPSWTEYGVAVGLVTAFVAVLLLIRGPVTSRRAATDGHDS